MGAWLTLSLSKGAGDGSRTRDLLLGRETLYQLSYSRTYYILPLEVSGWRELNPLPLGPKPSVLPMNYTPQNYLRYLPAMLRISAIVL